MATHESVKAVTARFTAEELITRRTEVRDAIAVLLKEKMSRHGLMLDEFNLINFAFSRSFADAIENKVKAEQQKQQAELRNGGAYTSLLNETGVDDETVVEKSRRCCGRGACCAGLGWYLAARCLRRRRRQR